MRMFLQLCGEQVLSGLSLLVLYSAPRGFSPGTPVFPSPQHLIWFKVYLIYSLPNNISRALVFETWIKLIITCTVAWMGALTTDNTDASCSNSYKPRREINLHIRIIIIMIVNWHNFAMEIGHWLKTFSIKCLLKLVCQCKSGLQAHKPASELPHIQPQILGFSPHILYCTLYYCIKCTCKN